MNTRELQPEASASRSLPVIGLTLGDVAGVGPEVAVKALADPLVYGCCRPLVLGDLKAVRGAAARAGLNLAVKEIGPDEAPAGRAGTIEVLPLSDLAADDLAPGKPTPAGGRAAALYIETGAGMALDGRIKALVTGPISKEALNRAGYAFPGHTEFLSHLSGGPPVVMMMAGPKLKVVLVTIHKGLKEVPGLVTREAILRTTRITHEALKKYFGLPDPRLAAAALNPHAGEGGLFGREEEEIIAPAVAQAQKEGIGLAGPFPPDTLFYRAASGEFDVVVAMYHDQGLIPFKLLHFTDGVNVTLGLPFIRTSVDHGTAYDVAGTGKADHRSMLAAIHLAADMVVRGSVDPDV